MFNDPVSLFLWMSLAFVVFILLPLSIKYSKSSSKEIKYTLLLASNIKARLEVAKTMCLAKDVECYIDDNKLYIDASKFQEMRKYVKKNIDLHYLSYLRRG